jgi:L-fucose mutarotase/ribose pyranase (RbsD/FucU family)
MRKMITIGTALGLGMLSALNTPAVADEQYPASSFQPSVIYIDKDMVEQAAAGKDEKYPAAHFEPKVIFSDDAAIAQSSASTAEAFDAKYPAAYYQPKVIYP